MLRGGAKATLPPVLFLIVGAVFATGFATTGGVAGTPQATALTPSQPGATQDAALLSDRLHSKGDLAWGWQGLWGSVESQAMYEVDLDGMPAGERFYLGVYLENAPSGFAELQLQLRIADVGASGSCDATAIASSSNPADHRVMRFDAADAQVTFAGLGDAASGLPGGSTYCVGVADYAGSGRDPGGTFIRRSSAGASFDGTYPRFVAALSGM